MLSTMTGFNTAALKYEDRFLALMLKAKHNNNICQDYYFQLPALVDLLLILSDRMSKVLHRFSQEGETYKDKLLSYNKSLMDNMPSIDMYQMQHPDQGRRVTSVTLKQGEKFCTLILILQDESIATLKIDDMQVEALIVAIKNSVHLTDDKDSIDFIANNMDYLMLYTLDLTNVQQFDYKQFQHQDWKINIFSHYLAILFCSEIEGGKRILSGAVIKTSASPSSEEEKRLLLRLANNNKMMPALASNYPICQIFSTTIAVEHDKILSMEECLQPLYNLFLESQKVLSDKIPQ